MAGREREREREREKERADALDGAIGCALTYAPERRAQSALAERKTEKEKLEEKERERERKRAGRARALVCYGWLTGLLSSSCPLCWALWLGLVLFLSSSCPCPGHAPELCGWALWRGSVSGSCPPLVDPCLGRAPELCGWALWPGLLERSVAEQIAMSTPTKIHR